MNNIFKKRRAYSPDENPADRKSQLIPRSFDIQPLNGLPHHFQNILQQAPYMPVTITIPLDKFLKLNNYDVQNELLELSARSTNIDVNDLRQLSSHINNHHHIQHQASVQQLVQEPLPQQTEYNRNTFKRPRLDSHSSAPMPSPYAYSPEGQDGEEKAMPILSGQPSHAFTEPTAPSGWTSPRLADCFASLSPLCPPYSSYEAQPAYQALPTSESYGCGSSRPSLDAGVISRQPQSHTPPDPTALTAYGCDDAAIMSQYLSEYPPLQPTSAAATGMQPPTSGEDMVYPTPSSVDRYSGHNFEQVRHVTGLGIQGHGQVPAQGQISSLGPPVSVGPSTMPTTFSREGVSPAFGPYDGFSALAPPFNPPEVYTIKVEEDGLEGYGSRSAPYQLFQHQKTLPARRGPFKDNEQRLATARTRKKGSCIRCRMQRIRCVEDPDDGPCIPCQKIHTNKQMYRLECLRLKITDVKLFKPGQVKGLEWTLRWKGSVVGDIGGWASAESRTIKVTEGYTGKFVELQVRQFQPQKGDRLERSWVSNGEKKTKAIPAFAIVDMDAARKSFTDYIKQGLKDCCTRLLGNKEMLLWQAYAIALRTMEGSTASETEKKLITNTLDLWMSVRLTTKSFEIVGDETLGMNRADFDDDSNPLRGKIPLPPVMGAQIDSILIHQVQPQLRRSTLEDLQKMTAEKKQKTWLTTFVVTFILLHNIALITKHDADYARKHGMQGRWARECNVREYNLGANCLLAYFHYCNKNVFPFSPQCKDEELKNLADLDSTAMNFVRYAREVAAQNRKDWETLWDKNMYENEYYYVSQLFEESWHPRIMA